MPPGDARSSARPEADRSMAEIADYVLDARIESEEAWDTARYMLADSMACAMLAMKFEECTRHLGPLVPGGEIRGGARVPGTRFELDPAQAAFNIGTQVRWLDFNDTWPAAEWRHPSDTRGASRGVADGRARRGRQAIRLRDVPGGATRAYGIQGGYALRNAFSRVGLDHVILVRLASTAVPAAMLGRSRDEVSSAIAHSWI